MQTRTCTVQDDKGKFLSCESVSRGCQEVIAAVDAILGGRIAGVRAALGLCGGVEARIYRKSLWKCWNSMRNPIHIQKCRERLNASWELNVKFQWTSQHCFMQFFGSRIPMCFFSPFVLAISSGHGWMDLANDHGLSRFVDSSPRGAGGFSGCFPSCCLCWVWVFVWVEGFKAQGAQELLHDMVQWGLGFWQGAERHGSSLWSCLWGFWACNQQSSSELTWKQHPSNLQQKWLILGSKTKGASESNWKTSNIANC